jgi:uncharacterized membrane protein YfcA
MNRGFSKDEGWLAVGAHLFLIILAAGLCTWLIAQILPPKTMADLPMILGLLVGVPLGDRLFHFLRKRLTRARQGRRTRRVVTPD